MGIEEALKQQGWQLEARNNWIAVRDKRTAFHGAFKTYRVGKLVDSKFYITVRDLRAIVERHILALGLEVEHIPSTADSSVIYPGFECARLSDTTLQTFVRQLRGEIEQRVQQ